MISAPSVTSVGAASGLEPVSRAGVRGFFRPHRHQAPGRHPHLSDAGARRRRALPVRSRRISSPSPPAFWCSAPGWRSSTASISASTTKTASRMSGWSSPCSMSTPIFSARSRWLCRPGSRWHHGRPRSCCSPAARNCTRLARRVDVKEIVTAGEFLILTGIILPLLAQRAGDDADDDHAPSSLARAGRRLHAVLCELPGPALLDGGGARPVDGGAGRSLFVDRDDGRAGAAGESRIGDAAAMRRPGITLATAIMYLRILPIVAVFNMTLARVLALPLCGLSLAGLVDLRAAIPACATGAAKTRTRSDAARRPAAIRCSLVRRLCLRCFSLGVARVELGQDAVRHLRDLFARRHCRHYRHRSFRAQSGARRHHRECRTARSPPRS